LKLLLLNNANPNIKPYPKYPNIESY